MKHRVAGSMRSIAAFPLRKSGKPWAVFSLQTSRPSAFDEETLVLFDRVASDASFALDAMDQEEKRRQNEEASRVQAQIIAQIHDSVISTDLNGYVTSWNKGAERLTGYSSDEVAGRHIAFLYPEDQHQFLQESVIAPLKQRGVHEVEVRMRNKAGRDFYAHLSLSLVRDNRGGVTGMIGYSMDITARKHAEQALRERARQQAAVAELGQRALACTHLPELMSDALALVSRILDMELCKIMELLPDRSGLLLRYGVGWEKGLIGTEIISTDPRSQGGYTLAAADPVIVENLAAETRFSEPPLLQNHGVASGLTVAVKEGERVYGLLAAHSSRSRPITKDDAHFLQSVANVLAAAIARRQGEIALQQSESRFRQMAENIQEVVWMTDEKLAPLYVSPSYEDVWGRPCESAHGESSSLFSAIHASDREQVRAVLEEVQRGGRPEVESRIVRPDGSIRWILLRASPVRDESGQVCRVVGIAQDITARRLADEEVKKLNEDLERRVKERTNELAAANAELELRNREVERANRLKSEFLAGMSHELRTPLNAIIGFSSLMAEERSAPLIGKHKHFIKHIQDGAKHLLELINNILDLSRVESGRMELQLESFAAADALDEVLSIIAPLAVTKRISAENRLPRDLSVRADRIRFKQILFNLLSNAVKFTSEEGRVCVESVAEEQGSIRFCVSDTGIGVPPEEASSIFDEFHQAYQGQVTEQGSGLGLAITRKLVGLHNGKIWVESEPGKGSRFFFTIVEPAGSPANPVRGLAEPASSRNAASPNSRTGS